MRHAESVPAHFHGKGQASASSRSGSQGSQITTPAGYHWRCYGTAGSRVVWQACTRNITWTSSRDHPSNACRPGAVPSLRRLLPTGRPGQHCPEVEAEPSAEVQVLHQIRAAQTPVGGLHEMRQTRVDSSLAMRTQSILVEEQAATLQWLLFLLPIVLCGPVKRVQGVAQRFNV